MDTINFPHKESSLLIHRKVNVRAKRLSLRVSLQKNAFVLTIPLRASEMSIARFLSQCTEWINKNVHKLSHKKGVVLGENISLFGTPFMCVEDPLRRKPVLCKTTSTLRLPFRYTQKALHDVFKEVATESLTPYVLELGELLGKSIKKISFRDTRSRWGSCSAQNIISLNWRLILAPPEVARYVCVHEAVHLIHMNHSSAFWKKVETLCPAYKAHRQWLKTHGYSLMGV